MKFVYLINEYKGKNMNELFGEKGTYILEIANLGLPVMNGLIVTTDACTQFYKEAEKINYNILEQVNKYINKLEQSTNKKFGNIDNPLLLSIKCSPKSNIPNIMDSVLNVGLTYDMVENLSKNTDEYIWIWECYLNFIKNYSKIIMGIDLECYEYVKEILNNNSQLIIATHSPILMAYPKAEIIELSLDAITKKKYFETEHYKITKQFLDDPDRILHYLID